MHLHSSRLVGRRLGSGIDPRLHRGDLSGRQRRLLVRHPGHLGVPAFQHLDEQAVVRPAGHERRTVFAAPAGRPGRVEPEPALRLVGTMTGNAMLREQRLHLAQVIRREERAARKQATGSEKRGQGRHFAGELRKSAAGDQPDSRPNVPRASSRRNPEVATNRGREKFPGRGRPLPIALRCETSGTAGKMPAALWRRRPRTRSSGATHAGATRGLSGGARTG